MIANTQLKLIEKFTKNTNKLLQNLNKLNSFIPYRMFSLDYKKALEQCVFDSEKLALDIRDFSLNNIKEANLKEKIMGESEKIAGVSVSKITQNIVKFTLPPLLNYRLKTNNKTYDVDLYSNILTNKIKHFVMESGYRPCYSKCVLAVFNIVANDINKTSIPDTDNRKYGNLVNVIKQFFIPDDTFEFLSLYTDTIQRGIENKTIAFLIPFENYEKLGAQLQICENNLFESIIVKNNKDTRKKNIKYEVKNKAI